MYKIFVKNYSPLAQELQCAFCDNNFKVKSGTSQILRHMKAKHREEFQMADELLESSKKYGDEEQPSCSKIEPEWETEETHHDQPLPSPSMHAMQSLMSSPSLNYEMAFAGKVALVTGSSSGIGRAVAVLFASQGAKVTISGRNSDKLEETRQAILAKGGNDDNINTVIGDVTSEDVQSLLINTTVGKFGKLDILINNAGAAFGDPTGKVGTEASLDSYHKNIHLNTTSVLELIQKARQHLIASKGEVVNVSSIASLPFATPYTYYSMAKGALDQLTRSLAIELIAHGVRVNGINPGHVNTDFMNNASGASNEAKERVYKYVAEHPDVLPARYVASGEDIAEIIAFLADRKKSFYIIGQTIVADGGTTLILAARTHDLGKVAAGQL